MNIYNYFQLKIIKVNGQSMSPCLNTNDIVLAKYCMKLTRKDIISFHLPSDPEKHYIKRIIGLPSEFIEFTNSDIIVDGKKIMPNNIDYNKMNTVHSWYLEPNQFFVLGDNYLDSYDSKSFGPININWVKYKIVSKVWPLGSLSLNNSRTFFPKDKND